MRLPTNRFRLEPNCRFRHRVERRQYQFRFYPEGEESPALHTMDGIPLYRWDGEQAIQRTEEEIEADRAAIPAPPPSAQEQLRADVDFLAAMQGVTL